MQATQRHPFTFYPRLGYTVTGVLPHVGGLGKHDIIMAKRLTPASMPACGAAGPDRA